MTKITLIKTHEASTTSYGSCGVRGDTPASYAIYAEGIKVGSITGGGHSRLACKSGYQTGEVKGKRLFSVGVRGSERQRMETEIRRILEAAPA